MAELKSKILELEVRSHQTQDQMSLLHGRKAPFFAGKTIFIHSVGDDDGKHSLRFVRRSLEPSWIEELEREGICIYIALST